jgi:hypothetical protein
MKLKKPLQYGTWSFYIGENDEIRVPAEGFARTRPSLVHAVTLTLDKLAEQGRPEFKQRAEEEAKRMKIGLNQFLHIAVEHQICVRAASRELCQSSGYGDKIHSFVGTIDDLAEAAPAPIKAAYQKVASAVTKAISGESKPRLSSCRSCGGTKSLSGKMFNLGRAGRTSKR